MQSETIGALAAALAKAQGEISPAPMDRDNPFFKSKYATLTSLWESARAALSANGLAVTQVTDFDANGEIVLLTTLLHSSGEWIGGVYPVRGKDNTPQALGSALTYARRYAFGALVGLTSDDDDDGNGAQNGTNGGAQHATKPTAQAVPNGTTTGKPNGNSPAKGDDERAHAMRKLHAIGADLYGTAKEWDVKRPEIVAAVTKNRATSSNDLTDKELADLTALLQKRVDTKRAESNSITVNGAQEMAH